MKAASGMPSSASSARDEDSAALLEAFENGSLPPAAFTHIAHFQVAHAYLQRLGAERGSAAFITGLRSYVQKHGAESKFHLTLSLALLRLIQARLHADESWAAFAARNGDLFSHTQALLRRHYSDEQLARGRDEALPADREPLP